MDWDPLSPGVPGADEDGSWDWTWESSSPVGRAPADWSLGDRSNTKRRRDDVEPSWPLLDLQTPVTDPVCGTFELPGRLTEFLVTPAAPAAAPAAPAAAPAEPAAAPAEPAAAPGEADEAGEADEPAEADEAGEADEAARLEAIQNLDCVGLAGCVTKAFEANSASVSEEDMGAVLDGDRDSMRTFLIDFGIDPRCPASARLRKFAVVLSTAESTSGSQVCCAVGAGCAVGFDPQNRVLHGKLPSAGAFDL
eukprot:COSAG05_NODE_661_length_8043_cov_22.502014_6_plen_251_part_00